MKKFFSSLSSRLPVIAVLMNIMLAIAISCSIVEGSCSGVEVRDAVTAYPPDAPNRERMQQPAPHGHGFLPSHQCSDVAGEHRRRAPSPPAPHGHYLSHPRRSGAPPPHPSSAP
ncbi:hypothetical protein SETIT_5G076900v2 [Setaria italica]|uniref:Uncharacterized protein n=1 Tax=Setaria italica TaxID=4555 RepID=A0A368R2Q9_SETIT|nr:hypothetical protein SETIT_5G076900v2 [Setaria italica]